MRHEIEHRKGVPYPLGATIIEDRINFAAVMHTQNECGVILYDSKSGNECRIPFRREDRIGNICCLSIARNPNISYEYHFYDGDEVRMDAYARRIIGSERWGAAGIERAGGGPAETYAVTKPRFRAGILEENFDWQEDAPLRTPYEDSVFYCTHVRGFTKAPGSGVKKKGTFAGVIEKIPYLKELGVKNMEFMPLYEFSETEWQEKDDTMQYAVSHYMDKPGGAEARINYWGYCDAYYFAPKASYAASGDCVNELKLMIRELHKNGIEVICQFYFPDSCKQGYILEVLKYWVLEYHIDGVHLMGNDIPVTLLATEPLFSNTKLIYYGFPYEQIYKGNEIPEYRNLAAATDCFLTDARRYLKSDSDTLQTMMWHFVTNPAKNGVLHYITNYYGFTLYDLVSYEHKHNEANGEDNRDGSDQNYSWNCGVEGMSRKSAIVKLRMRQMRNAMAMVVLSQGTPFLMAGDEDCNTQKGNNNPYCQDNAVGWKDWNSGAWVERQRDFMRKLLAFRAAHPVFRKKGECSYVDRLSCGYPEISFHSEEAYRFHAESSHRHIGLMYAGAYGNQKGGQDADVYVAYNMHWTEQRFALPKLRKGYVWKLVMDTALDDSFGVNEWKTDGHTTAQGRSIQVLVGMRSEEKKGTAPAKTGRGQTEKKKKAESEAET
ncbi:MAG: alpha-amylase family glycosyl hydrolase [bacterium]|nr:alpha-amylase family glycosyl hydrolase [bacterium]